MCIYVYIHKLNDTCININICVFILICIYTFTHIYTGDKRWHRVYHKSTCNPDLTHISITFPTATQTFQKDSVGLLTCLQNLNTKIKSHPSQTVCVWYQRRVPSLCWPRTAMLQKTRMILRWSISSFCCTTLLSLLYITFHAPQRVRFSDSHELVLPRDDSLRPGPDTI